MRLGRFLSHRSCYGAAEDEDNYGLSLRDNHVTNRTNTEGKPVNYYAHTANDGLGKPLPEDSGQWQPLDAHLRNVAELAKQFAAPFGLAAEAELAGLLHDLGKYAERFQLRLRNPAIHGINHWAAGAAHAYALKNSAVAFAADGHHTGIPALNEAEAGTPLRQTVSSFADANRRLELTGQCPEDVAALLSRFNQDGLTLPPFSPRAIDQEQRFAEALRTRMLFSCLVDADFLDTEEHFDASKTARRTVPDLQPERALQLLRQHLDSKPADGPVNALRKQLLHDCWSAAAKSPGLFTLTAPTGSGKTLASLAFALRHIIQHNARLTGARIETKNSASFALGLTSVAFVPHTDCQAASIRCFSRIRWCRPPRSTLSGEAEQREQAHFTGAASRTFAKPLPRLFECARARPVRVR